MRSSCFCQLKELGQFPVTKQSLNFSADQTPLCPHLPDICSSVFVLVVTSRSCYLKNGEEVVCFSLLRMRPSCWSLLEFLPNQGNNNNRSADRPHVHARSADLLLLFLCLLSEVISVFTVCICLSNTRSFFFFFSFEKKGGGCPGGKVKGHLFLT